MVISDQLTAVRPIDSYLSGMLFPPRLPNPDGRESHPLLVRQHRHSEEEKLPRGFGNDQRLTGP